MEQALEHLNEAIEALEQQIAKTSGPTKIELYEIQLDLRVSRIRLLGTWIEETNAD